MILVIKSSFDSERVVSTSMNADTLCEFTHFAHVEVEAGKN